MAAGRQPPGGREATRAVVHSGILLTGLSAIGLSLLGWVVFRVSLAPRGEEPAPGGAPVALIVSPVRFDLSPGDSIRLRVEGVDANAEPVRRIRPVWAVVPPDRATVDSTGLVVAQAAGDILVTATVGRRSSTASGRIRP